MLRLPLARGVVALASLAAIASVTLSVACSDDTGTSIAPGYTADAGPGAPQQQPDTGTSDAGLVCTTSGGPVTGPVKTRCVTGDGGKVIQEVSEASCHPDGGTDGHDHDHDAGDAAAGADAAAEDPGSDYGDTLNNSEGDDDDCKYHVKFAVTNACTGADASFNVHISTTETGSAVTKASVRIEAFLDETHPAPNSDVNVVEGEPGTYKVDGVKFDKPGKWTVRFHFFEECSDALESSPHGHTAFFVDVP